MKNLLVLSIAFMTTFSCQQALEEASSSSSSGNSTLYVATGVCTSGVGITTYTSATATRTIERYSTSSGANLGILFDYASVQAGVPQLAYPAAIYNSGSKLYVLNEGGASLRGIVSVPKASPYTTSVLVANNSAAFSSATAILRNFVIDDQGDYLIGAVGGVEKFNSVGSRLVASGAAWVTSPGGGCANGTTNPSSVVTIPTSAGVTGHVIAANQGATAALNKISIFYGATGYVSTTSCVSATQISAVTHTKASNLSTGTIAFHANGTSPTSMLFIPYTSGTVIGKLLVTYSNGQTYNAVSGTQTTLNHGIVAWDVNQTTASTASISNPIALFTDHNIVFAASAMVYDSSTSSLYVAVGGALGQANQASSGVGYNIEKFTLDMTNVTTTGPILTRVSPTFILGGSNTKCISGLAVGE